MLRIENSAPALPHRAPALGSADSSPLSPLQQQQEQPLHQQPPNAPRVVAEGSRMVHKAVAVMHRQNTSSTAIGLRSLSRCHCGDGVTEVTGREEEPGVGVWRLAR